MATSAKKTVVKEPVITVTTLKVPVATQAKKSITQKAVKAKNISSTVKTVLSPAAAWPFPTGPRP